MKLKNILLERKYAGPDLEAGGTARGFGTSPAPALRKLASSGAFEGAKKILDYGAGSGRNSAFLREMGFKVYAFDPYNGQAGADGWEGVSTTKPKGKFDVGFTSFVLNVVPVGTEKTIVNDVKKMCKETYHITRNMDIFNMVKRALGRGDRRVTTFFLEHFADEEEAAALEDGTLSDQTIMEFCNHGLETSSGFQRIPVSEETSGLTLVRETQGFKVYKG